MRFKKKLTRPFRRAATASLLIAATVALSGCWNNVEVTAGFDGTNSWRKWEGVLTQKTTDDIFWSCSAYLGSDHWGVAGCALDSVRAMCQRSDTEFDTVCYRATSRSTQHYNMYNAIYHEHGITGTTECLAYWEKDVYEGITGPLISSTKYWGARNRGYFGCPG